MKEIQSFIHSFIHLPCYICLESVKVADLNKFVILLIYPRFISIFLPTITTDCPTSAILGN